MDLEHTTQPMTLVEKLAKKKASLEHTVMPSKYWIGFGIDTAIDIVKQHQSWHKMPSDEKPQDMQVCNLLVKNESEESPTLYDIGLYREYKSEDVWLCMTRPEEHIDPSKILAWQPVNEPSNDFFKSLEQLPSEEHNDESSD